jgi:hypothetical protein
MRRQATYFELNNSQFYGSSSMSTPIGASPSDMKNKWYSFIAYLQGRKKFDFFYWVLKQP